MDAEKHSPPVTVVVVAYGAEPLLEACVRACLASEGLAVEVVVVDNGCTDGGVAMVARLPGVHVVDSGENVGFAEGCNVGVSHATADLVALVNPDAVVAPDALGLLVDALRDETVGIATASVRFRSEPTLVNAEGNEVHFLGLSWCRGYGRHGRGAEPLHDVAAASGAALVLRRSTWNLLGGMRSDFFMYYDDIELSLRVWLAGLRVVCVPAAVVWHDYDAEASPEKFARADRNRILALLSLFETRTLLIILPPLLAQEIVLFGIAAAQGWLPHRVSSLGEIGAQTGAVRARRRVCAQTRRVGDGDIAPLLTARIAPDNYALPGWAVAVQAPLAGYWRIARRLLRTAP